MKSGVPTGVLQAGVGLGWRVVRGNGVGHATQVIVVSVSLGDLVQKRDSRIVGNTELDLMGSGNVRSRGVIDRALILGIGVDRSRNAAGRFGAVYFGGAREPFRRERDFQHA